MLCAVLEHKSCQWDHDHDDVDMQTCLEREQRHTSPSYNYAESIPVQHVQHKSLRGARTHLHMAWATHSASESPWNGRLGQCLLIWQFCWFVEKSFRQHGSDFRIVPNAFFWLRPQNDSVTPTIFFHYVHSSTRSSNSSAIRVLTSRHNRLISGHQNGTTVSIRHL